MLEVCCDICCECFIAICSIWLLPRRFQMYYIYIDFIKNTILSIPFYSYMLTQWKISTHNYIQQIMSLCYILICDNHAIKYTIPKNI